MSQLCFCSMHSSSSSNHPYFNGVLYAIFGHPVSYYYHLTAASLPFDLLRHPLPIWAILSWGYEWDT